MNERGRDGRALEGGAPSSRPGALLSDVPLQLTLALPIAAFVASLSAVQVYVNWRGAGVEAQLGKLLLSEGVEWGLWALAVPVIVALDNRLEGNARVRIVAAHLAAAVTWFAVLNLALAVLTRFSDPEAASTLGAIYRDRALMRLPSAVAVYAFLVAGIWLVRSLERQERLRRGLLEAQLRSLRAQIQPHFLFNTLHTAASLVRSDDREGAVHTLVGLGDLLRRSLGHEDADEVPLAEEIEFLRTYLDIQRRRFGDRLEACIRTEPELERARVPFLLLQPLVENAIRHGLDLDTGAGRVDVRIAAHDGRLRIEVEDSGGGRPEPATGLGIGLDNVRARLEALYGTRHELAIGGGAAGGVRVRVDIPLDFDDDG